MNRIQITARTDQSGCVSYLTERVPLSPAKRRRLIKKLVYKHRLSWDQAELYFDHFGGDIAAVIDCITNASAESCHG